MTSSTTNNPVPSDHPLDARKNFETIDEFVSSDSESTTTRTGKTIQTLSGIESLALEQINRIGFEPPVTYVAGLLMERVTQTVLFSGDVYHAINVPFTTSGTFETNNFELLRATTTSDLSSSQEQILGDGSSIFPELISSNIDNGDTIPSGTTHLRYLGEIVLMSEQASGVISNLTSTGCTVGTTNILFLGLGGNIRVNSTSSTNTRTLSERFSDVINVKDFGAVGDYDPDTNTGTDDTAAFAASILVDGTIYVPTGRFDIDSARIFSSTKPIYVRGNGHASYVHVGDNNTDNTAFRVEAVGDAFGPKREMTKWADLNFTGQGKTGIDCQAVFPVILNSVRFEGMGQNAIKLNQCFYGRLSDVYFTDSGMNFNNVNNIAISGGDISGIASSPNYGSTDYAIQLIDCDRITFDDLTFESWRNPVIRATEAKALHFRDTWFESNTANHVIKLESCQDVTFSNNYMELFPSPSGVSASFILVDNSNVIGIPRLLATLINIDGGYLRLNNQSTDDNNFKLVDVTGGGRVRMNMTGITLRSGIMELHEAVTNKIKGMTLSTSTGPVDEVKFVESLPTVDYSDGGGNTWCPLSLNTDTEMSSPAVTDETSGGSAVTIVTGTSFAHNNGIATRVTFPSTQTATVTLQHRMTLTDNPITTEGETFVIFYRIRASHNITLRQVMAGTFSEDWQQTTDITLKSNNWVDYVMKTSSDVTWSQGRFGVPRIRFLVTNDTGENVTLDIDRIDYMTIRGDHYLQ